METQKERIMIVVSDPEVGELVAGQTLQPLGYQVNVLDSASTALKEIEQISPDLIITDLVLAGISGKDLLVALASQGINIPIVVIVPKGHENDALQAFRLGAMNFLVHPIREAEVVNVVEDTLRQFRKRNEIENDARQLEQVRQHLEQHISDLIEVFSIGKLVPSAANQQALYEKVIHTAAKVLKADMAWMTVLDIQKNKYILRACLEVGESLQSRLNQPYEDNLSSLVVVSGNPVSIHGEGVEDCDVPEGVEAVLAVPINWKDEVVGMLAMAKRSPEAFTGDQQVMLEMVAEYTAALIENFRRFQLLEQRIFFLQQSNVYTTIDADLKNDLLHQASLELRQPLKSLLANLEVLMNQPEHRMGHKQTAALNIIQEEADILVDIADAMSKIQPRESSKLLEEVDLNDLVRQVISRYSAIAQICRISLRLELPAQATSVRVFPAQISRVIEGMVSNALKYSPAKSQVTIQVEKKTDRAILVVKDQGSGIDINQVERIFDQISNVYGEEARRFGGLGASLPIIKEIISAHKGEIWVESGHGEGFKISISLPL